MDMEGKYEEYADFIYKFIYRLSLDKNISEELTQETFYQAVKSIDTFRGDCRISTWLCQIAKHCWCKYLKTNVKNVSLDDIQSNAIEIRSPDKIFFESHDMIEIYKKIHILKEPYKEVTLLRIVANLSFSEIGAITEKTENWARVTFHRAKLMLIEGMDEYE